MSKVGRVGSGGYGWDAVAARKPLFTAHSGRKRALIPRKLFCVPEQSGGRWYGPASPFPLLQTPVAAAVHQRRHSHVDPRLSCLAAHAAAGNVPPGPGD